MGYWSHPHSAFFQKSLFLPAYFANMDTRKLFVAQYTWTFRIDFSLNHPCRKFGVLILDDIHLTCSWFDGFTSNHESSFAVLKKYIYIFTILKILKLKRFQRVSWRHTQLTAYEFKKVNKNKIKERRPLFCLQVFYQLGTALCSSLPLTDFSKDF